MSGTTFKSSTRLSSGKSTIRSSESPIDMHQQPRITDRIAFINHITDNNRFEGLLMTSEDASHIVHHDHDDDSECKDAKCILRKRVKSFGAIISKIGGTFEYIKSGTTGHTLKGTVPEEGFSYAIKIVAYPKKSHYKHPNDIERPENAELLMLKLLSQLVVNRKTPHIILPIGTFNTDLSEVIAITRDKIIDSERYKQFIERYEKSEFYPQASVLLSEWAEYGDLLDYIRSNYQTMKLLDWQVIFFQFLQGLATIQQEHPAFRHNDAKANNLLCRSIPVNDKQRYHTYKGVGRYSYLVPNIGVQLGLWDFDFACIPGEVNNTKVTSGGTDRINVKPVRHQYYDVHFFFNTLGCTPFFPKLFTSRSVPDDVKEFVDRVVPQRYRGDKRYVTDGGRIKTDEEVWTPLKLLETDPFFKDFRFDSEGLAERKQQIKDANRKARRAADASRMDEERDM
jgi:hypothetical protein